jgi:class 3 adenylate cyclase/pimeloyl-ACP methyl ester carboxylesterase
MPGCDSGHIRRRIREVGHPETRYAWNGDIALAYQVLGDGPIDVVYLQGWISNVELNWESPYLARFLRGLASLGRLVVSDRRGWGCSDRFSPSNVPPLETLIDDLAVVMDAVGSDRFVLTASLECAAIATLFAATHPDRISALVLIDPWVTFTKTEEAPGANSPEDWDWVVARIRTMFPLPGWVEGHDEHERTWLTRYIRTSVSPGAAIGEFRRFQATDVRRVLPLIQVPTLVFADSDGVGDGDPANARFVAERITGSRLIFHASGGSVEWQHWYDRAESIVRDTASFLGAIRTEEARFERVLATVLFTDIVGSTEMAAELGGQRWRDLLQQHHAIVRALLTRYRGTEVDTAGDGFFATFDGPARAIRCAQAIVDGVIALGIQVRIGLHTGECETIDGKVGGIAVNIGARVAALATASEVLVSQTVKDLVAGSGLAFEDRGEHELKGVPETWRLYRVVLETA